jgi:predicted nucleic acid-binding protein
MNGKVLIDTDVLIDYLRGLPQAERYLENEEGVLFVSAINIAEIYSGIKSREELIATREFLSVFSVVSIDKEIAEKGGSIRYEYGKSHNVGLADALIAASAEAVGAIVVTLNKKHFPMLKSSQVIVPYGK